jgi:hypothetical protein
LPARWGCAMTQPRSREPQLAAVVLCCTDCQHVYQPDLVATLSATGCERCGGWTWIAQSGPVQLPRPRAPHDNQFLATQGRRDQHHTPAEGAK